ncbi:LpxI family protein [Haloferula sp.]|uniref:LpxI family protein n=1 Tax=Haloferula sp. TaxID=2497595 RepID=UPI00329BAFD6
MEDTRTIGIIAGKGVYPEIFIRAARSKSPGIRLVVAAVEGEADRKLEELADEVVWLRVGQLGKVIKFFKSQGATESIMVGQVAPKNLFDLRPDMRTLMLLTKIKERNAETLFGAVAGELDKESINLLPAITFLEDLLPPAGPVFGPRLKKAQLEDAAFGFRMAKETSRLDIGQTVVVRHGTVLAVEAFEGTNKCIRRGGELGHGKDVMLVKVSKPNQDFRFDVPVIGPQTIEVCAEAGVLAIVVEAGRTLLLERDRIEALCNERGVCLHAAEED